MLKEVCQLVAETVELKPSQYTSFDCYQMDHNGLSLLVTKGKGDEQTSEKIAISGPFEILGRVRDPNGEGWARLLRWSDDDKRVAISLQTLICMAIFQLSALRWQAEVSGSQPVRTVIIWSVT